MTHKRTACEVPDWSQMTEDWGKWLAVMNAVPNRDT
jgi:hypothetical protein